MVSRRDFLRMSGMSALALAALPLNWQEVLAQLPARIVGPAKHPKIPDPAADPTGYAAGSH